ncbi:BamA/TamA family outer membrane protein [Candidatus Neomarinimicrobiota bacterium]
MVLLLLLIGWLAAQEETLETPPEEVKVDPSGEIKIFNDLHIPEGEVRSGAIRIIGGNLTVAGRVTGRITVLGGDVELLPTAQIDGTIVALGGRITRSPEAQVEGDVFEVNRGKISISREDSEQIFGSDDDRDTPLAWDEEAESEQKDEEWMDHDIEDDQDSGIHRPIYRSVRPDFGISKEPLVRYNRSEGFALYVPFGPDTDDIPGFHVYGAIGRAFGPGEWYARLGIGEYLLRGRLGLIAEAHREPQNDDTWRITSTENSLGAVFMHQDWHDWYETSGYSATLVLAQPGLVEFKARYRNEEHFSMPNVTDWSVAGRDEDFRLAYDITEGREVTLRYSLALGSPLSCCSRRFQTYLSYAHMHALPNTGSDFEYTREDIAGEAYVPIHKRLGIRAHVRTGAIDGTINEDYGLQHLVPVGGIGSVQGYDYKDLSGDGAIDLGNHYGIVQLDFVLWARKSYSSLSWHYGGNWDSPEHLLSSKHIEGLQNNGYHALGISIGGDDMRLELFRPLHEGAISNDWIFYLRILEH